MKIFKLFLNTINDSNKKWNNNIENNVYKSYYRHMINLNLIILMIFNFKFYIVSLERCYGSIYHCFSMYMSIWWLIKIIIYYFVSTFITSIYIFLSIHKFISRYYLIPICIFQLGAAIIEKGDEPANHGLINTILLPFILLFYLIILEIIYNLIKCYKKKKYVIFAISLGIIIIGIIVFDYLLRKACRGWENGLGNTKIDFFSEKAINENGCYPAKPKRCLLPLVDGLLDFNKFLGSKTCDGIYNKKSELIKYAPHLKNAKNIAYPLMKFKDISNRIYLGDLSYWVLERMYDLDNLNNVSDEYKKYEPEAIVHFDDKDKGTLEIKVIRNETAVKQKLENIKKTKDEPVKFENILFLYIDSLSRVQFLKRMPLTREILERYYSEDISNLKDEKYMTFQFLKYLNFEIKTTLNTVPMFAGGPYDNFENKTVAGVHITKYLDDHGYMTAFGNEQCSKVLFDLSPGVIDHIKIYPFDHEINSIFCDPNYVTPERFFNNLRGINAVTKRCLYGKETYKHLFDFGEKFLKTYEDYPRKFLRLGFFHAHETSMEIIKYMDKDFSDFLNNFIENNYDKNYAIIIAADHGNGLTFYRVEDWSKEASFAMLFILLPKNSANFLNISLIRENEQKVVTPYDIFNTLVDMVGFNKTYFSVKGDSTLQRVESKHKTCQFFDNEMKSIDTNFCSCIPYKK